MLDSHNARLSAYHSLARFVGGTNWHSNALVWSILQSNVLYQDADVDAW